MKKGHPILGNLGWAFLIVGVLTLTPLLCIPFYPSEFRYLHCFLIPAGIAFLFGFVLKGLAAKSENELQSSVVVVMTWVIGVLIGGMPFIINGQLNFTQACFEAMSGWTTCGLTVVNVAETAHVFLLWRSIMHFFGGVGIVFFMLLLVKGGTGMALYSAEGRSDRIQPSIKQTVLTITKVYFGFMIAGTIMYVIVGMPVFDAINHSMSALSTGGFSTRVGSIGEYNSVAIEWVTIFLMLVGTVNFAVLLLPLHGKWKDFFRVGEIQFMFFMWAIGTFLIYLFTRNVRWAFFESASAMSTAGYSTTTYVAWHPTAIWALIFLMIVGGGAGSTAGGIKLYRVDIMIRSAIWKMESKFMPEKAVTEHYIFRPEGKVFLKNDDLIEVYNLALLYLVIYTVGVIIITGFGYSVTDAMFEFASSIGTVGLSIGVTSPAAHPVVLWTETIGMLFGRLEIIVIFAALGKLGQNVLKIGQNKQHA